MPQCRSRHTQGAAVVFWIRGRLLFISKVTVMDCVNNVACGYMRETVTQISYETGGGLALGPLDRSQGMCRGAAKEATQTLCRGRTLTSPLFQTRAI